MAEKPIIMSAESVLDAASWVCLSPWMLAVTLMLIAHRHETRARLDAICEAVQCEAER